MLIYYLCRITTKISRLRRLILNWKFGDRPQLGCILLLSGGFMEDVQQQLKEMRTLVQEMGWGEFMRHVGSLMAEQSDKTSGDRSSALFACSNTVHALVKAWDGCGNFEYPDEMTLTR
ncbi:hypothetical protein N9B88_01225 [Rubripirellula sp.]|nr:hypothetical protein [Rubripirellula sp.]